jgi:hypothetical protein
MATQAFKLSASSFQLGRSRIQILTPRVAEENRLLFNLFKTESFVKTFIDLLYASFVDPL